MSMSKPVITNGHKNGAPSALQILYINEHSFRIDTNAFKIVLDKVPDFPIVLLSINGAAREGKSYALNYFIRYLRTLTTSTSSSPASLNWYDLELAEHEMFSWRGGSERETLGINLWSEPFIIPSSDNPSKKIAVLLMDCQGLFDNKTTFQENAVIFSLSNLLSSVMIYNVKCRVEENLLQNLQFFSDYARAITIDSETDPVSAPTLNGGINELPNLTFLIRDFEYLEEYEFGSHTSSSFPRGDLDDPQNYWHSIFTPTQGMPRENQCVRFEIMKNFDQLETFILPHPGNVFLKKPTHYKANEQFRHHLKEFVLRSCSPSKLCTKKVGGREVTGREFYKYVETWAKTCKDSAANFPDAKTIGESTMIMQNEVACSTAFGSFSQRFQEFFKSPEAGTSDSNLGEKYKIFLEEAIQVYQKLRRLGGDEIEIKYIEQLSGQCEENYNLIYKSINEEIRKRKETDQMRDKERKENTEILNDLNNQMTNLRYMNQKKIDEMTQNQQVKDAEYQNKIHGLSGQINDLNSQKNQIEEQIRQVTAEQQRKDAENELVKGQLLNRINEMANRPPVVIVKKSGGCSIA